MARRKKRRANPKRRKKTTTRKRRKNPVSRKRKKVTTRRRRKNPVRAKRRVTRRRRRRNPELPSLKTAKIQDVLPWVAGSAVGWAAPGLILGYLPARTRANLAKMLGGRDITKGGLRLKVVASVGTFMLINYLKKQSKMVRDYEVALKLGTLLNAGFNLAADFLPKKGMGARLRLAMNIPNSFSNNTVQGASRGRTGNASTVMGTPVAIGGSGAKTVYAIDQSGLSDVDHLDSPGKSASVGSLKFTTDAGDDGAFEDVEAGESFALAGYEYIEPMAGYEYIEPMGGYEYIEPMAGYHPEGMGQYATGQGPGNSPVHAVSSMAGYAGHKFSKKF